MRRRRRKKGSGRRDEGIEKISFPASLEIFENSFVQIFQEFPADGTMEKEILDRGVHLLFPQIKNGNLIIVLIIFRGVKLRIRSE